MSRDAAIEALILHALTIHGPQSPHDLVRLVQHYAAVARGERCEDRNCAMCWRCIPSEGRQ
jgi:hypothetical protein